MDRPLLSVITPNYNMGRYLPEYLDSIVTQSRPAHEVLILDDGSTDDSVEIIESYVRRHPFIRLIRHPVNQGLFVATDRILQEARGEFVYPLSSDDIALPGFFETAIELMERYPRAGAICGQVIARSESGKERLRQVRKWRETLYATPARFLEEYLDREASTHSLTCATIYRKAALREVGFRRELGYVTDHFAFRAVGAKDGICYIARPCAVLRLREESYGSRMMNDPKTRLDVFGRMAYLMRSPEYRDRFPESHTRRWYRRAVWRSVLRHGILSVRRGRLREGLSSPRWFFHEPDLSCYR